MVRFLKRQLRSRPVTGARVMSSFGGGGGTTAVRGRIVAWAGFDGEKAWAVPNRAGNGPRDRRQAGIGGALPDKAVGLDRDDMAAALIIADQYRADLEVTFAPAGAAAAGEAVQQFEG